jgi:hypothetical protein
MNSNRFRFDARGYTALVLAALCTGFVGAGCTQTIVPGDTESMDDGMTGDEDVNSNGDASASRTLAVFEDPDSDFTTDTVRDVDGETMQFDTTTGRLIWLADDSEHAGWNVRGNALNTGFQVRFGTEEGERRAYFTEVDPPTLCDLSVVGAFLSIRSTTVEVPQETP